MENPPVPLPPKKNQGKFLPVTNISLCPTKMEEDLLTSATKRKGGQNLKVQEGNVFNF
jgi:hypothetical protein